MHVGHLTDDIRLSRSFSLGEKRQLRAACLTLPDPPFEANPHDLKSWEGARGVQRAARGSGITAPRQVGHVRLCARLQIRWQVIVSRVTVSLLTSVYVIVMVLPCAHGP